MEQRPIKLRYWDKNLKKMEYGGSFFDVGEDEWVFGIHTPHPDDCEIMQWTGMNDKNGVPIFEGDVLKFFSRSLLQDEMSERVFPISWNEEELCWWVGGPGEGFRPTKSRDDNEFEIVGNIYESPTS